MTIWEISAIARRLLTVARVNTLDDEARPLGDSYRCIDGEFLRQRGSRTAGYRVLIKNSGIRAPDRALIMNRHMTF